jgi:hypothetical protein
MPHPRLIVVIAITCSIFQACIDADEPDSLLLGFEGKMGRVLRKSLPNVGVWKYFITQPGDPFRAVSDFKVVASHIKPNPEDSSCRLLSNNNYVGIARLVEEEFAQASTLSWQWAVTKHPHNGKLGGVPNDQSLIVYVFFREPTEDGNHKYRAIGYCWTHNTTVMKERLIGRMPWSDSPKATIEHVSIRNGSQKGFFEETVNVRDEFEKRFGRKAPPIYGLVLLCDSNSVTASDFGEMTTDAVVRNVQLTK